MSEQTPDRWRGPLRDPLNASLWAIAKKLPQIDGETYEAWIDESGDLAGRDREKILSAVDSVARPAGLSVLTYDDGGETALGTTFAALAAQIQPGLETVVGCRPGREGAVLALAERAGLPNVVTATAADTGADLPAAVTALENAALARARGDFAAFLAPGDRLPPEAVAEVLLTLAAEPDLALVYTDEDWIDPRGRRQAPRFKAAWDPDAQLGFDQIGRFSPFLRALAGTGLDAGCGLAAHYDLHCRLARAAGPGRIAHVAAVLRHAAVPEPGLDEEQAAERYAAEARTVARAAAFALDGKRVEVTPAALVPWFNRIRWPLPDAAPRASIIIPTRDRAELVENCVRSILDQTDYPNYAVVILDNGSVEAATADLFATLCRDPRVSVLHLPGPFNYARINNDGARAVDGEILVLLNNDVEVIGSGWLRELVSQALRPEIGCVGAKLVFGDTRIQHAGVTMTLAAGCAHVGRLSPRHEPGLGGALAITRAYSAVTAACLALRRAVFEEVGGLDAAALKVGYNDVDLCLKLGDHGYRVLYSPFAELYHLESVSRGANDDAVKMAREKAEQGCVRARWADVFRDDPFQNPNVALSWEGQLSLNPSRRPRIWTAARNPKSPA